MASQDYYALLGVAKTASAAEIKRAYKRLAQQHHPDKNAGSANAEKKFQAIQQAYSVLSNDEKRAVYDRYGEQGLKGGFPNESSNPFSFETSFHGGSGGFFDTQLFANLFSGQTQFNREETETLDREAPIALTMEEVVQGARRKIEVPTKVYCSLCSGKGEAKGSKPARCSSCQGKGQVLVQGFIPAVCPRCQGKGSVISNPCTNCSGSGVIAGSRTVTLDFPPGYAKQRVFREKGAGGVSGKYGDLYVHVEIKPHRFFTLKDQVDLICKVPITFAMAALGGEIEVPTLYGPYALKISPETQSHTLLRISGKGLPNARTGRCGDLYCRVVVEVPVNLKEDQKKLLREMDASLRGKSTARNGQKEECTHQPMLFSFFQKVKEFFAGESK